MKILVCITKTPDTTSKVAFKNDNTQFDDAGVQWIINPYDEWYSLVKAVELKETDPSAILHILTLGDAGSDAILRKALSIGGDEAIRINGTGHDAFYIASQIAAVAKQGSYDLILTGKESIDYNSASVGATLAALLDWPYAALTNKLSVAGSEATITHEIDGGEETLKAALPLVIGSTKGLAEQRIPNMRGIMGARSKPLHVTEPIAAESLTEITSFELPAAKAGVRLIEAGQEAELVRLLQEEAKVI